MRKAIFMVLCILTSSVFGFELLPREEIPEGYYENYVEVQIIKEASMIPLNKELKKIYRSYSPIGISCESNAAMAEFRVMLDTEDYAMVIRSDIDELYEYCILNRGVTYPGNPLPEELAECAVNLADKFNIDPTTPFDGFVSDYNRFIRECMTREEYIEKNQFEIREKLGEDGMDRIMNARDKFFLKQINRPKPCANGSCPKFSQVVHCNDEDGDCSEQRPASPATTKEDQNTPEIIPAQTAESALINHPVVKSKVTPSAEITNESLEHKQEGSEQITEPLKEKEVEPIKVSAEIPKENFLVRILKKFFGVFS